MRANFHRLFFAVLLFSFANALFAQTESDARLYHRFTWTADAYALRYEVLIEMEDSGIYRNVLREFTYEPFIYFPLTPGIYRLRVIPFDFRDLPGAATPWRYFRVFARIDVLDPEMVVEDLPDPFLSIVEYRPGTLELIPDLQQEIHRDFFIAVLVEGSGYTRYYTGIGGGLKIGGSFNGMGLGIRLLYAQDTENFIFMEALAQFRMYLPRTGINSGFFLQADGGIVFFARENPEISNDFSPSAGLSLGWRFPLGARWFAEPSIRGGYPYIFGASLSAGIRF